MPYGIARFIGRRQPAIFAALPPTAFLPRKNSTGLFGEGKSDDGKEEDAGILAYAKDDDAVSADLHMGSPQGRKTLWGKEDAPQRGGLPVRVSTTKAEVASDVKACVSLSSEGIIGIASSGVMTGRFDRGSHGSILCARAPRFITMGETV